jgi:hypothetical protein
MKEGAIEHVKYVHSITFSTQHRYVTIPLLHVSVEVIFQNSGKFLLPRTA